MPFILFRNELELLLRKTIRRDEAQEKNQKAVAREQGLYAPVLLEPGLVHLL